MEIKFRIWNEKDKFWLPNCGLYHDGTIIEECVNDDTDKLSLEYVGDGDSHVVCLFTGMKDNNGIEIYFGDIIKCWDSDTKKPIYKYGSVIYLYDLALWFIYGDVTEPLADWKLLGDIEVVGNIYENNLSDFTTRDHQTLTWQQIQEGYKEYELHKYDWVY